MVVEGAHCLKISTISKDLSLATGKIVIKHYSEARRLLRSLFKTYLFSSSQSTWVTNLHKIIAKNTFLP